MQGLEITHSSRYSNKCEITDPTRPIKTNSGDIIIPLECWNKAKSTHDRVVQLDHYNCIGLAQGKIDDYAVYFWTFDSFRYVWHLFWYRDTFYFSQLRLLTMVSGAEPINTHVVLCDIRDIYFALISDIYINHHREKSGKLYNIDILRHINDISQKYDRYKQIAQETFALIYFTMLAEEYKSGAKAKSAIKMLEIYEILVNEKPTSVAAKCDNGLPYRVILSRCRDYGIFCPVLPDYLLENKKTELTAELSEKIVKAISPAKLARVEYDAVRFPEKMYTK